MRAWLVNTDHPVVLELDRGTIAVCDPVMGWDTRTSAGMHQMILEHGLVETDDPEIIAIIHGEYLEAFGLGDRSEPS